MRELRRRHTVALVDHTEPRMSNDDRQLSWVGESEQLRRLRSIHGDDYDFNDEGG